MSVYEVADRIRAEVPSLTVYEHGVPWRHDEPAPHSRYVVVRGNGGLRLSDDLATSMRVRVETVWVTVVAEGALAAGSTEHEVGARCLWAVERCQRALVRWRLESGHFPTHIASQPVTRDDDVPDRVVAYAVDQWSLNGRE